MTWISTHTRCSTRKDSSTDPSQVSCSTPHDHADGLEMGALNLTSRISACCKSQQSGDLQQQWLGGDSDSRIASCSLRLVAYSTEQRHEDNITKMKKQVDSPTRASVYMVASVNPRTHLELRAYVPHALT